LKITIIIIISCFLFSSLSTSIQAYNPRIIIFGNENCNKCFNYVTSLHVELLNHDISDISIRYFGGDSEARRDLQEINERFNVPISMRSSVAVIIDNRFIFEGYVPKEIIIDFISEHISDYQSFVIYRDSSRNIFILIDENGVIKECQITNSITECIPRSKSTFSLPILPLIIISGLLDGINPCAFAVLLFFLTFLFRVMQSSPSREMKRRIIEVGTVYITSIYIAYLLIGIGILNAIAFLPFSNLIALLGAILVITLGIISIKDYFFPGKGISLKIPSKQWKTIARLIHKATIPSTFLIGFIVALFEFPCTGGIYVAILGMLAVKASQLEGIIYLLLYNIAFVIPLIAILVLASNRQVVEKLRDWQKAENLKMKLLIGLFMIALGAIILIFLI